MKYLYNIYIIHKYVCKDLYTHICKILVVELVYDSYAYNNQNHFPMWLYYFIFSILYPHYFIFSPAVYDSSSCSTSSIRQCITIFLILAILVSLI